MIDLTLEDLVSELMDCGWRPIHDQSHKNIKKFWQLHQPDNYDASCIKILAHEDVVEKFDWAKIGELADKYKRDPKWIENGFEACRASSVSPDYFVQRYLEGNKDIPKNPLVEQAYLDLTREARA